MALFPRAQSPQNPAMSFLQAARGNPQQAGMQLMQSDPRFAQFMNNNRGKSPQQILSEYMAANPGVSLRQLAARRGLDYGMFQNLM